MVKYEIIEKTRKHGQIACYFAECKSLNAAKIRATKYQGFKGSTLIIKKEGKTVAIKTDEWVTPLMR